MEIASRSLLYFISFNVPNRKVIALVNTTTGGRIRCYIARFNRRDIALVGISIGDHVASSAVVSRQRVSIVSLPSLSRLCGRSATVSEVQHWLRLENEAGTVGARSPFPGRLCRSEFRLPATITGCYANRQRTFRADG